MEIRFTVFIMVGFLTTCMKSAQLYKPASYYFKICHRNEPNYPQCLRKTVEDLLPQLVEGIQELDIVPIDPLKIPRIEYHDKTGGFEFHSVHTNLTIHGMSDVNILSMNVDVENLQMDLNTTFPFMRMTSDYEITGRILLLPIYGKGDSEFNFTNVATSCRMLGKLVVRDGVQYLKLHDIYFDTDISGAKVRMGNLFNGDKTLGDAANKVFNDNWREAFETYKHLATESISTIFKDMVNKVLFKFPFEDLYPE
ncbi:protein takeout-like [Periplaneta americana]|uniref:protein takeout-like n=1 Tax=Periplaneta americana TaxID=6978 RepID=UPI0037E910EC